MSQKRKITLVTKLANTNSSHAETVRKLQDRVSEMTSTHRRDEQRNKRREAELLEVKSKLSECRVTSENQLWIFGVMLNSWKKQQSKEKKVRRKKGKLHKEKSHNFETNCDLQKES